MRLSNAAWLSAMLYGVPDGSSGLHGDAFERKSQVSHMHKESDMHSRSVAWRRLTICFGLGMVLASASFASEGSASVYPAGVETIIDRKSTRLNSSHLGISYAVFCLK